MKHFSIKNPFLQFSPSPAASRGRKRDVDDFKSRPLSYDQRKLVPSPVGVKRSAYSATLYPNGEFGIGYVPLEKQRISDQRYSAGVIEDYKGTPPGLDSVETSLGFVDVPLAEQSVSSSNLVSRPKLSHPRGRYGKNGITSYGKTVVRNIAERIQSVYGRKRTGFFTLTLPDFPDTINLVVCREWSHLVRCYFQELRRFHQRHGKEFHYVSVTEIQSRRWIRTGNPGLHLHYVTPLHRNVFKRGDYLVTPDWIRTVWQRLLQNLIDTIPLDGVEFECPMPRVSTEHIRESAASYLGKYMSKGGELIREVIQETGESYLPKQWWSVDAASKNWLRKATAHLLGSVASALLDLCKAEDDIFLLYSNAVTIVSPHMGEVVIGYSGRMSAFGISAIMSLRYD